MYSVPSGQTTGKGTGQPSNFGETEMQNNRAAQTGVFDLDIRISNRMFIDVCTP
jgi:hypothetical protein